MYRNRPKLKSPLLFAAFKHHKSDTVPRTDQEKEEEEEAEKEYEMKRKAELAKVSSVSFESVGSHYTKLGVAWLGLQR